VSVRDILLLFLFLVNVIGASLGERSCFFLFFIFVCVCGCEKKRSEVQSKKLERVFNTDLHLQTDKSIVIMPKDFDRKQKLKYFYSLMCLMSGVYVSLTSFSVLTLFILRFPHRMHGHSHVCRGNEHRLTTFYDSLKRSKPD
jgi:hypothetical protein